jgi:hypothetical protein
LRGDFEALEQARARRQKDAIAHRQDALGRARLLAHPGDQRGVVVGHVAAGHDEHVERRAVRDRVGRCDAHEALAQHRPHALGHGYDAEDMPVVTVGGGEDLARAREVEQLDALVHQDPHGALGRRVGPRRVRVVLAMDWRVGENDGRQEKRKRCP